MALTKVQDRIVEPGGISSATLKKEPVVFFKTNIDESYTIEANTNGLSVGPVTFANGVSLTIASGQRWIVL